MKSVENMIRYFGKGDKIVFEDIAKVSAWVFCEDFWCDNCEKHFQDHDEVIAASDTKACFHRYCIECWSRYERKI